MTPREELYTDVELVKTFNEIKDGMTELKVELAKTQVMIKQYNGLRERVEKVEAKLKSVPFIASVIVAISAVVGTIIAVSK